MNVIILGSGGCVSTPRACCNCRVCTEARQKGFPYARTGCSLFVKDVNLLIDTPEDINASLNNSGIQKVEHLEEDWGKSYDDYRELERELNLIHFAYDGLKIQL